MLSIGPYTRFCSIFIPLRCSVCKAQNLHGVFKWPLNETCYCGDVNLSKELLLQASE